RSGKKYRQNYLRRSSKKDKGRRVLAYRSTRLRKSTNFIILELISYKGKSTISGIKVNIEYYYVILKEYNIYIKDNRKLVVLAISDI
ncbi:hypothetical protein N7537_010169, partial [Penicillium hordei]